MITIKTLRLAGLDDSQILAIMEIADAERRESARTKKQRQRAAQPLSFEASPTFIADPNEFDWFWEAYPRKVAKGAARKAYVLARKKVSYEGLMAGLKTAKPAMLADPKYIPHPATWLNQERWADERPAQMEPSEHQKKFKVAM